MTQADQLDLELAHEAPMVMVRTTTGGHDDHGHGHDDGDEHGHDEHKHDEKSEGSNRMRLQRTWRGINVGRPVLSSIA